MENVSASRSVFCTAPFIPTESSPWLGELYRVLKELAQCPPLVLFIYRRSGTAIYKAFLPSSTQYKDTYVPEKHVPHIIGRIKMMSGMDLESKTEQVGRFRISFEANAAPAVFEAKVQFENGSEVVTVRAA